MATAAPHPFIRGTKIHGVRIDAPAKAALRPLAQIETDAHEVETVRYGNRKGFQIGIAAITLVAVCAGSYAAYSYGSIPDAVQPAQASGVQRIELASTAPAIVGNRIPDDYPGIYPGERLVTYHLTPLPNEVTVEETDEDGCRWLRVEGKTEGLMAYPLLGDDGNHVCSDPALAIAPERARMVSGAMPVVPGSSIRVLQVQDTGGGRSAQAASSSSTPFLPNYGDQGTVSLIRQQVAQQLSSQPAASGSAGTAGSVGISGLPSQSAPTRTARISTASDADANPTRDTRPAIQTASLRREQRPAPQPMEPIRRAPAYVPPADDEMVPISQNPTYAGDAQVSMSEGGSLRAIRPGDPPRLPGQRQADAPGGSPLEGYASISGK